MSSLFELFFFCRGGRFSKTIVMEPVKNLDLTRKRQKKKRKRKRIDSDSDADEEEKESENDDEDEESEEKESDIEDQEEEETVAEKKSWVIAEILDEKVLATNASYERQYQVKRQDASHAIGWVASDASKHNEKDKIETTDGSDRFFEYLPLSVVNAWRAEHPLEDVRWQFGGTWTRKGKAKLKEKWIDEVKGK
jgi:hypothetical protein